MKTIIVLKADFGYVTPAGTFSKSPYRAKRFKNTRQADACKRFLNISGDILVTTLEYLRTHKDTMFPDTGVLRIEYRDGTPVPIMRKTAAYI